MLACIPYAIWLSLTSVGLQAGQLSDWPSWRGPHGDGVSRETGWTSFGAAEPVWERNVGLGDSCSAIVDGRLYTSGHREDRAEDVLSCLDAVTGEVLWSFSFPMTLDDFHPGGTLNTPIVDLGRVYLLSRDGMLRCFDASMARMAAWPGR